MRKFTPLWHVVVLDIKATAGKVRLDLINAMYRYRLGYLLEIHLDVLT